MGRGHVVPWSGEVTKLTPNVISESIYAQCDAYGN